MASLPPPPPPNTTLPPPWPAESTTSNSFREASFSSYLSNSEETYIRNLVESRSQRKIDDSEIDVFSADKYFNGRIEERNNSSIRSRSEKFQEFEVEEDRNSSYWNKQVKVRSRGASSSNSEVSSNSQSALLKRFQRTPSRIGSNEGNNGKGKGNGNGNGNGMISLLSCSCCVKKSVDIEREVGGYHGGRGGGRGGGGGGGGDGVTGLVGYNKGVSRSIKTSLDTADITRLNKLRVLENTDPFVFPPILASSSLIVPNKIDLEEEEPRKSLDVFGSSGLDEGSRRFSLQKRLNMLAWDAIPRTSIATDEINTSGSAPSETYKDTESNASSDLFEIECLSCSANPVNLQAPRVLTSDGSATPTTGYAPSEASIEWSVVTASVADFSCASDFEDQRSSVIPSTNRHKIGSKPISSTKTSSMNKEVQKPTSSSLLLGCKSQKAVNVAQEVHRKSPSKGKSESQRMHRLSDSFVPVTRFQAEAKLSRFGLGQRQSFSNDLLYIQ